MSHSNSITLTHSRADSAKEARGSEWALHFLRWGEVNGTYAFFFVAVVVVVASEKLRAAELWRDPAKVFLQKYTSALILSRREMCGHFVCPSATPASSSQFNLEKLKHPPPRRDGRARVGSNENMQMTRTLHNVRIVLLFFVFLFWYFVADVSGGINHRVIKTCDLKCIIYNDEGHVSEDCDLNCAEWDEHSPESKLVFYNADVKPALVVVNPVVFVFPFLSEVTCGAVWLRKGRPSFLLQGKLRQQVFVLSCKRVLVSLCVSV